MQSKFEDYIKNKKIELDSIIIPFINIYANQHKKHSSFLTKNFGNYIYVVVQNKENYFFYKKIIDVEIKKIEDYNNIDEKDTNPENKNDNNNKVNNNIDNSNNTIKFQICSTYELFNHLKENNIKSPYMLVEGQKYSLEKIFNLDNLKFNGENNKMLLYLDYSDYLQFTIKELPTIENDETISFMPKDLTLYFDLLFKYNDSNALFVYYDSPSRKTLMAKIITFKGNKSLKFYKICGPSGIGKSITLFLSSKLYANILYFNLKVMNSLKNKFKFHIIYNLVIESCYYLDLTKEQQTELEELFSKIKEADFFDKLIEIINYFIENKLIIMIILDQFKNDVIDISKFRIIESKVKIQDIIYVKLLICASTNDYDIRDELKKSWSMDFFNDTKLTLKNEEYFFYINRLNDENKDKDGSEFYNDILSEFNYLAKYKNKFKKIRNLKEINETTNKEILDEFISISNTIKQNLYQLYSKIYHKENPNSYSIDEIKPYMVYWLNYLNKKIGQKLNYDEIKTIIKIISIKYYIFDFQIDGFTINYNFNFIRTIIEHIINDDLEGFYQNGYFEKHTGYTIGDYFEQLSIKALVEKKLNFENINMEETYLFNVKEISNMKEFHLDFLDNSMKLVLEKTLQDYKVKKEDLKNKNIFANEFGEFKDIKDYIYYKNNNIDFYKAKYIREMKTDYIIKGNKQFGDLNVFIKQINENGKKIDFAFLTGKKDNKEIYLFQMKSYDDEKTHSVNFNETKSSIKENIKEMLINSEYLLGMTIKSWHYIVVISLQLINNTQKYSKKLEKKCQENGLEYIFFEPLKRKFYDKDFAELTKYIGNKYSNLNVELNNYYPINFIEQNYENYQENFLKTIYKNINWSINKFIKNSIKCLLGNQKDIKKSFNKLISEIQKYFGVHHVKFIGAYKFMKCINIPQPKNNFIILYREIETNNFYIFIKRPPNMQLIYFYSLEKDQKGIINKVENHFDVYPKIEKKKKFYVFIIEDIDNIYFKDVDDNESMISLEEEKFEY